MIGAGGTHALAREARAPGPGALPSDAHTLGINPMVQRDRQDEALGVIIRLLRGEERFSYESEWFTLRDAQLQILPLQEDIQMATALVIPPEIAPTSTVRIPDRIVCLSMAF